MLIMIDEAVSAWRDAFTDLGDVRTFTGRSVQRADLFDADAVVVRAVTRVDEDLLAGSRIRFVGTVTSGTDHVDTAWLARQRIAFADAAGSNARPVAEYILAAILLFAERLGFDPSTKTLGVIGAGRIGSIVADWARFLGMRVLCCDPPLQRLHGPAGFVDSEELRRQADIVTLHVPLTIAGPDPTHDMVNARWLDGLKPGAIFINTSRGDVVREADLLDALARGRPAAAVLDVWRNEPDIDLAMVDRAAIATPHVAGHSIEARRRAAWQVRDALRAFLYQPVDQPPGAPALAASPSPAQAPAAPQDGDIALTPAVQRGPGPMSDESTKKLSQNVWHRRLGGDFTGGTPVPQEPRASARAAPPRRENETPPREPLPPGGPPTNAPSTPAPWWRQVAPIVEKPCDLAAMDSAFRSALKQSGPAAFDAVRSVLSNRHEFGVVSLERRPPDARADRFIEVVGFQCGTGL